MKNILIIGLGNIGFYHFTSISKNKSLNIYLCDSNNSVIKKLKNFKYNHFYSDISEIKSQKFDIVIFSMNADQRYFIFKSLIKNNICKNIIFEKVAFNCLKEISSVKKILAKNKINSWVNCNYQTIPFFKTILNYTNNKKFEMKVFGGQWSIGTSAIHFIEFFSFLSNSKVDVINFETYSGKILKAKRKGYFEFDGIFKVKSKNGSIATIEKDFNSKMPLHITIKTPNIFLIYEVSNRTVYIYDEKYNWKRKKILIKVFLQSELTNKFVKNILYNNKCDLPYLYDSLDRHHLMLSSIKKEFQNTILVNKHKINIT